jgi:hypothetical protein
MNGNLEQIVKIHKTCLLPIFVPIHSFILFCLSLSFRPLQVCHDEKTFIIWTDNSDDRPLDISVFAPQQKCKMVLQHCAAPRWWWWCPRHWAALTTATTTGPRLRQQSTCHPGYGRRYLEARGVQCDQSTIRRHLFHHQDRRAHSVLGLDRSSQSKLEVQIKR